jgi:hypothetical protein
MSIRRLFPLAALAVGALLVSSCGDNGTDPGQPESTTPIDYRETSEPSLRPGDPVPAPAGPVVLTVRGLIGTTNVDDSLQFDMETLERLGVVEYSIDDRLAEGRVATFGGVLLDRLLEVAAVDPGATNLATTALNDYSVDIPVADAERYPVLLATTVDGERMPVERYGPVRVIYPYGAFGLEAPEADEKLIWQLTLIEVR